VDIQGALRQEERRLAGELEKVRNAIEALGSGQSKKGPGRSAGSRGTVAKTNAGTHGNAGGTGRRRLSAAARSRIARAQRRRWAKVRAEKQG
jgi:hypothetical protein